MDSGIGTASQTFVASQAISFKKFQKNYVKINSLASYAIWLWEIVAFLIAEDKLSTSHRTIEFYAIEHHFSSRATSQTGTLYFKKSIHLIQLACPFPWELTKMLKQLALIHTAKYSRTSTGENNLILTQNFIRRHPTTFPQPVLPAN